MSSFRQRLSWILLGAGLCALALVVCARVAGAEARTRAAFAAQRVWLSHWPFSRGSHLPLRLEPLIGRFIPIVWDVEPGIRMRLDPHDSESREILASGGYEFESWAAVAKHLPPGGTLIDVGAHIGSYTLKAAKAVGPTGQVIAIEPNPNTLEILRANISASGAGMVTVQPVACSESESTLEFFASASSNTGESSLSRSNAGQDGPVPKTYRVRARPLDDIVQDLALSRVDAVKIDVEGAEFLVLKGAKATLARFHPYVIAELLDGQLKAMGTSPAEVTAFMRANGYVPGRRLEYNVEFVFRGQPDSPPTR